MKRLTLSLALGLVLGMASAQAALMQILLDEDFQDVSGITSASTVRTVQDILTNNPTQLPSGTAYFFVNTGSGNASAASFNVRRGDNAIDGASGSPTLGNSHFDNFFGGSTNRFLVVGDDSGDLSGAPNGGTGSSKSTMSIRFGLAPITLQDPRGIDIFFDYVFDANNTANPDDFIVQLILADNSTYDLLSFAAPTATTRGTFNAFIPYTALTAAPTYLNFRLVEYGGNGSSAVGLDNIKVTAIPEPGMLGLLGLGLLALGLARRHG